MNKQKSQDQSYREANKGESKGEGLSSTKTFACKKSSVTMKMEKDSAYSLF